MQEIPRSVWKLAHKTGTLLKEVCGRDDWEFFLEKTTTLASLYKSGLNDSFYWYVQSTVFCISFFNSSVVFLASWIIENIDI